MARELTMESPFPVRFKAWIDERFALEQGILFLVLYATAVALGKMSAGAGEIGIGIGEVLGFAGAWCFFFMLRVFDEHKDYEEDCKNYPERVLQSGLITLGHLKVAGGIAIAVQLGVSLALDAGFGPVTMWWLGVFAYSALMGKEFFVGEWLSKRLLLYAVSHMVIMPLSLLWMAQIGAGEAAIPLEIGMLAGLSFLSGAAFEVTRKTRGPEEERDEVDSYSKILGTTGAPVVIFLFLAASAVVQAALLHWIFAGDVAFWWYLILAVGVLPAAATLVQFAKAPSEKGREKNEGTAALAMLTGYVVVMAAAAVARGVTWV
jgi:4-hydroxybenzoate polyprenyltransferase